MFQLGLLQEFVLAHLQDFFLELFKELLQLQRFLLEFSHGFLPGLMHEFYQDSLLIFIKRFLKGEIFFGIRSGIALRIRAVFSPDIAIQFSQGFWKGFLQGFFQRFIQRLFQWFVLGFFLAFLLGSLQELLIVFLREFYLEISPIVPSDILF